MTADDIKDRVIAEANARLADVIDKMFPIVRCHHAHDAWRAECGCSYCHYIRHVYVPFKLQVHKLKKRIRYLEWATNDVDIHAAWDADKRLMEELWKLHDIKQEKKQLKEGR